MGYRSDKAITLGTGKNWRKRGETKNEKRTQNR
jgi:hypothetical protein